MTFQPLDAVQIRILGALVEKQRTVPDTYPLSMNALVNACNQTSNRDPVVQYDEATVANGVRSLRERALVRGVNRADARVARFQHLLDEKLDVDMAELALLGVLMLRGPQTAGELRTRTERLFVFDNIEAVDASLESLMSRETPLVVRLARRPGQKEVRYAHLLGGDVSADHPEPIDSGVPEAGLPMEVTGSPTERIRALEVNVEQLRDEVNELRARLEEVDRRRQQE